MSAKRHVQTFSAGINSTLAGGTGGTILALCAQNMRPENAWRSWCIIAAPSLTIGIRVVYLWVSRYLTKRSTQRNIDENFDKMEASLVNAINDQATPEQHRVEYRERLHKMRQRRLEIMEQQIENLTAVSAEANVP